MGPIVGAAGQQRLTATTVHAASVNYRDLIMVKGMYLYAQRIGAVQGSDGAGEVAAVGSKVTRFAPGDKVVTIFHQGHIFGTPRPEALSTGLGGALDGVFRQHGVFDEEGLVALPRNLSYLEGSTLPCAAVSAWNSLYGLPGRVLKAGDWVLVQGSGGVSVFALQFAKAAGARVVATTSTAEKVEKLKRIGADHVVNYKEDTNWGETVRKLTGGEGVQHVVEVGGPATINQVRNFGTPHGGSDAEVTAMHSLSRRLRLTATLASSASWRATRARSRPSWTA